MQETIFPIEAIPEKRKYSRSKQIESNNSNKITIMSKKEEIEMEQTERYFNHLKQQKKVDVSILCAYLNGNQELITRFYDGLKHLDTEMIIDNLNMDEKLALLINSSFFARKYIANDNLAAKKVLEKPLYDIFHIITSQKFLEMPEKQKQKTISVPYSTYQAINYCKNKSLEANTIIKQKISYLNPHKKSKEDLQRRLDHTGDVFYWGFRNSFENPGFDKSLKLNYDDLGKLLKEKFN